MPDRTLALEIAESGSGAGAAFTFHLRLDNDVIASNQDLTIEQSRSVRELSRQYGQLFVAAKGLTPLFKAAGVKRRLIRGNTFTRRGGGAAEDLVFAEVDYKDLSGSS